VVMQSADPAPSAKDANEVEKSASSAELEQVIEKVSRRTVEMAARKLLEQLLPRIEHLESALTRLENSKEQSFLEEPDSAQPPATMPLASERPAEERAWDRLRETIDEPVDESRDSWLRVVEDWAAAAMTKPTLRIIALATAALGTVMMGALFRALTGL
jgi:hypothetical protein